MTVVVQYVVVLFDVLPDGSCHVNKAPITASSVNMLTPLNNMYMVGTTTPTSSRSSPRISAFPLLIVLPTLFKLFSLPSVAVDAQLVAAPCEKLSVSGIGQCLVKRDVSDNFRQLHGWLLVGAESNDPAHPFPDIFWTDNIAKTRLHEQLLRAFLHAQELGLRLFSVAMALGEHCATEAQWKKRLPEAPEIAELLTAVARVEHVETGGYETARNFDAARITCKNVVHAFTEASAVNVLVSSFYAQTVDWLSKDAQFATNENGLRSAAIKLAEKVRRLLEGLASDLTKYREERMTTGSISDEYTHSDLRERIVFYLMNFLKQLGDRVRLFWQELVHHNNVRSIKIVEGLQTPVFVIRDWLGTGFDVCRELITTQQKHGVARPVVVEIGVGATGAVGPNVLDLDIQYLGVDVYRGREGDKDYQAMQGELAKWEKVQGKGGIVVFVAAGSFPRGEVRLFV